MKHFIIESSDQNHNHQIFLEIVFPHFYEIELLTSFGIDFLFRFGTTVVA